MDNNKTKSVDWVKLAIIIIVAVLATGIVFIVDKKEKDLETKSFENVIQNKKNDLSSKEDTTPSFPPTEPPIKIPESFNNLSGKIIKLEKDTITFNAEVFSLNEENEQITTKEIRKATTDSSTKFNRLSFDANGSPAEEKIEFKDFEVGDYVEIISDKDVSKALEFNAIKVRILP